MLQLDNYEAQTSHPTKLSHAAGPPQAGRGRVDSLQCDHSGTYTDGIEISNVSRHFARDKRAVEGLTLAVEVLKGLQPQGLQPHHMHKSGGRWQTALMTMTELRPECERDLHFGD